jgi:hypothetical protein
VKFSHFLTTSALAGWLASSCVTPPAASVESLHGKVRAPTEEEAAVVAELLDDLHPRVRALLPGTEEQRVEVWLQEELRMFSMVEPSHEVVALNFDAWNRIHLKRGSSFLPEDLAHELVHLMLDESWNTLPPVLEEGLADHVGLALNPNMAPGFRAGRLSMVLGGLGRYSGRVRFGRPAIEGTDSLVFHMIEPPRELLSPLAAFRAEVREISPHSRSTLKNTLYGLGFLAVERIIDRVGFDGLHQLAVEAGESGQRVIPAQLLLDAARLDADPESWVTAALESMGRAELAALATQQAPSLAAMLVDACASMLVDHNGESFLAEVQPMLSLVAGGPEVSLAEIPAVRASLSRVWPVPHSKRPADSAGSAGSASGLRAEQ